MLNNACPLNTVLVKNDNFYSENTDLNVCVKSHETHKVTKCQCQSDWNYTTISTFIWHSLRSTGLSTVRTHVSYANAIIGTRRGMWEINYGLCHFGMWSFFWHASIDHIPSIVWVWISLSTGLTKFWAWPTTWWSYTPLLMVDALLYPPQASVTMILPGRTRAAMVRSGVGASRRQMRSSQHLPVARSMVPTTQNPRLRRPRWYFLLKECVSSVSAYIGSPFPSKPPNATFCVFSYVKHSTRIKLL